MPTPQSSHQPPRTRKARRRDGDRALGWRPRRRRGACRGGGLLLLCGHRGRGPGVGRQPGRHAVGSTGSACLSFNSTANLPIGDGGMVTTDDPERAGRLTVAAARHSPAAVATSSWATSAPRPARGRHPVQPDRAERRHRSGRLRSLGASQTDAWPSEQVRRTPRRNPGSRTAARPIGARGEHSWQTYSVRIERPRYERDRVAGRSQPRVRHHLHHSATAPPGLLPRSERDARRRPSRRRPVGDRLISLPIHPRLAERRSTGSARSSRPAGAYLGASPGRVT